MTRLEEIESKDTKDILMRIPEGVKEIAAYIICMEFNSMRRHSVNQSKEAMQMNEYFEKVDKK